MVSLSGNEELGGFAVSRFIADIENSEPFIANSPTAPYKTEVLAAQASVLQTIITAFSAEITELAQQQGAIKAQEVFKIYDRIAKEKITKFPSEKNNSGTLVFINKHRGDMVAAFAAEHAGQKEKIPKEQYLKQEVAGFRNQVNAHCQAGHLDPKQVYGVTYIQFSAQRTLRPNATPTFYDEVMKALMDECLKQLSGSVEEKKKFLEKMATDLGYPPPELPSGIQR